ncbi:MAG: M20/M25/M40 family metallo-hydrolase [Synergistaceae bacterium]|jgi:arginine utilization protein RocB|nr:M20/M25/M40 family metallo-hydrolase [Synergistaceae bacterium]
MRTIEEILFELVAIRSDTGTPLECDVARKIRELLDEEPYFRSHPEYCGCFERGDIFKRPVVWALKKGLGSRTLILMGHYDAVEIESYGLLKPYALSPLKLKEKMLEEGTGDESLRADLAGGDWLPGRGIGDMKAGLAINMHTLFSCEPANLNILFVAVPDEENMSSGALQSVYLYEELKEKFGLDYAMCLISEPQIRAGGEKGDITMYSGTMGKFLPLVMAKGVLTHAAEILHGLNSSFIIAEIIHNMELTTDLVSSDRGAFTQPPTVQIMRDLKTTYDVSVPEYSVLGLNVLFLGDRPPSSLLQSLMDICRRSMDSVIARYNSAFDFMRDRGFIGESSRKKFRGSVMTLSDLRDAVRDRCGGEYESFAADLDARVKSEVESGRMTQQNASVYIMKSLLDKSGITDPVAVVGVSPPYYPATCNEELGRDTADYTRGLSEWMKTRFGVGVEETSYLSGMTDMSYMSCCDPVSDRAFLRNLAIPEGVYDVPVERMARLNIPSFLVGPAGRNIHQAWERVYMPDVRERIPELFRRIAGIMDEPARP